MYSWAGPAYRKRARRITGGSPAPTSIKAKALVCNNSEDAAAPEGLGVRLTLYLEHVEGQQDNLSDANQADTSQGLARTRGLAEASTHLPAVECMIALPVFFPNADSKSFP